MKFFLKFALLLTSLSFFVNVSAQEIVQPTNNKAESDWLRIDMVDSLSSNQVDIYFTEPVDINSVSAVIENQATKETVKVVWYEQSETVKWLVHVNLDSKLNTSTPYKITVKSVTSTSWNTIVEGIDAIRDFVTPANFYDENSLNAPNNPSATVIETTNTDKKENSENLDNKKDDKNNIVKPDNKKPSKTTNNLPSTGVETSIYILAAILSILAIMIVTRKKA